MGVDSPPLGTPDRIDLSFAAPLVPMAPAAAVLDCAAPLDRLCAGRAARVFRLVYGCQRLRRAHRRQPVPLGRPFGPGAGDLRLSAGTLLPAARSHARPGRQARPALRPLDPAGLAGPNSRVGRTGRGPQCRPSLQQLSCNGWRPGPSGLRPAAALVGKLGGKRDRGSV